MTVMRTTPLVAAMAIALAGLAACDGGGSGDAAPDHACDLLTTDEVEDLLGEPTNGAAEDSDRSRGTYCRWASEDSGTDLDASDEDEREPYYVSVEDETGALAVQGFEASKPYSRDEADGQEAEILDGLGDDAYFRDPHGLSVRHGDRVFSTFADGNKRHRLSNRESKVIERRAAEIVITRLGEPENESVADQAAECARTRRCSGTRYRACDLLRESEITRITGFDVGRVDGTARPGSSSTGALCDYYLDNPDDSRETGSRFAGRVKLRFEPDARAAQEEYRRLSSEYPETSMNTVPGLGDDAFVEETFGDVWVLENDTLLSISYELDIDLPAGAPAIESTAIDLAEAAVARI